MGSILALEYAGSQGGRGVAESRSVRTINAKVASGARGTPASIKRSPYATAIPPGLDRGEGDHLSFYAAGCFRHSTSLPAARRQGNSMVKPPINAMPPRPEDEYSTYRVACKISGTQAIAEKLDPRGLA